MRISCLSLMPPQKAPALALGIVIAVSLIVLETLAVIQLKRVSPENSCGIFFLLGIVVVSTVWGVGLAVATSVASALAFAYLCSWPTPVTWVDPDNLVMIATFIIVALSANGLAFAARIRTAEADERRREVEASNSELIASRARIITAADDARRRFERDLHDGAQQRLVSLGLAVRAAQASVPADLPLLREQLADIAVGLGGVCQELQEVSRGIHPAILSQGGLGSALKSLARRSAVPVKVDVTIGRRLPESAEVALYYVVAEALTNAAKHAQASLVWLHLQVEGSNVHLSIRDDGMGGADATRGSGLIGLMDRVEAVGGHLRISSHAGCGTSLIVHLPVLAE
jgi:signal transduction histidine kinase